MSKKNAIRSIRRLDALKIPALIEFCSGILKKYDPQDPEVNLVLKYLKIRIEKHLFEKGF